jgi:hypothetical protein
MAKTKIIPSVRRITVDEKLSDDLIRLEICTLKCWNDATGEFVDLPDDWLCSDDAYPLACPSAGDGAGRRYYVEFMGIPESMTGKYPWNSLHEGQVFLSGEFRIERSSEEGAESVRFFVSPGNSAFERIDDMVKRWTKTLYYEVIAGGSNHG